MALTMVAALLPFFAAYIAICVWHGRNIRRWAEIEAREDTSLAGAMERSRRHHAGY